VIAWQFWNAPSGEAPLLRRLQARRCGQTGRRLWKSAEVDHRVPVCTENLNPDVVVMKSTKDRV
jgi:hypothetical protein